MRIFLKKIWDIVSNKPVEARLAGGVAIFVYFDIIFMLQVATGSDFMFGDGVVIVALIGSVITGTFSFFMSRNYANGEENNNGVFYVLAILFGAIFLKILFSLVL